MKTVCGFVGTRRAGNDARSGSTPSMREKTTNSGLSTSIDVSIDTSIRDPSPGRNIARTDDGWKAIRGIWLRARPDTAVAVGRRVATTEVRVGVGGFAACATTKRSVLPATLAEPFLRRRLPTRR